MPINLELKIRLDNPAAVMEKIQAIKAEYNGELNQVDVYYRYKKGLLKLRTENGSQTLIKYNRNEKAGSRWSDYQLISLENNDAREYLADILETETVVEKRRQLYLFDNTRIHLDTVKGLGSFLELETLVINGRDDAEKRFNTIVKLLELDLSKQIKASYKNLMDEKKNK